MYIYKRKLVCFFAILSSVLIISCHSGYELVGVHGERIAMDSSFDDSLDEEMVKEIDDYKSELVDEMSPVIGFSAASISCDAPRDYNILANVLSDMVMDEASRIEPDVAFAVVNVGGLRKDLPQGPITVGTAFEILPFMNTLCIVDMDGSAVLELFRQIAALGGEAISAEVNLTITRDGQLLGALLSGAEVQPDKTYKVATIDYVAEGNDGMEAFKKASNKVFPDDELFRDIFIRHVSELRAAGLQVEPKTDRRIIVK